MTKVWLFFFFLFFFLFFYSGEPISAKDNNRFVVIANPVRISSYTKNPEESLKSEYKIINKLDLPATWLLTSDVLDNPKMVGVLKEMNGKQELGIFLEVTPSFAKEAGVQYVDTGFWHHAGSVFLSGYTQEERILLIDSVLTRFRETFGYDPLSVGSWWTDSYSLSYMKAKYGIISNLVCSDQFSTDGYQIWGQPWQVPYYPSKYHNAIFASGFEVKLDLVNLQWASRDPLNGYYSSLFSTQDYLVSGKNLNTTYFEKLIRLYTNDDRNEFGQITVGLEADFNPEDYQKEYLKQMKLVSSLKIKEGLNILTMKDFANWYRGKYPKLSPQTIFETEDLLGSGIKSVWEENPEYRLFYTVDPKTQELTVRDLRFYENDLKEPYYDSPNKSFSLNINIPSIVDEVGYAGSVRKLSANTKDIIGQFTEDKFNFPLDGVLIKELSSEAKHFFKQKKFILLLVKGIGWNYFKKIDYQIPQGELYALSFLKKLPQGRVLVYDGECLQCEYHTKFKPPAFANIRGYVREFSNHPILYNNLIVTSLSNNTLTSSGKGREEVRKNLKDTGVKYIYLVKFESYFEMLPFSPGDLGVEKIYSNANAEIWMVLE